MDRTPGEVGLGTLLPATTRWAQCLDDPPDVLLFETERDVIRHAVDRRRREFGTVRHCARTALAALGRPAAPLVPGPRGAPRWPPGVVGSMTHCEGYRGAAVAAAHHLRGIGIDAEPDLPLPAGLLEAVARPDEVSHLGGLPAAADALANWDRLLFSCKESVFKIWYPLTGRELGFEEVSVRLDPYRQAFTAALLADTGTDSMPPRLLGTWTTWNGLLLSAIALPAGRT